MQPIYDITPAPGHTTLSNHHLHLTLSDERLFVLLQSGRMAHQWRNLAGQSDTGPGSDYDVRTIRQVLKDGANPNAAVVGTDGVVRPIFGEFFCRPYAEYGRGWLRVFRLMVQAKADPFAPCTPHRDCWTGALKSPAFAEMIPVMMAGPMFAPARVDMHQAWQILTRRPEMTDGVAAIRIFGSLVRAGCPITFDPTREVAAFLGPEITKPLSRAAFHAQAPRITGWTFPNRMRMIGRLHSQLRRTVAIQARQIRRVCGSGPARAFVQAMTQQSVRHHRTHE